MKKEEDFIRASIAMAVYNGEKYIRKQIDSILTLMNLNDELIISYDDSRDNTWKIIEEYSLKDKRIKIYKNKIAGVANNFSNAISYCSGQYIFLADQDDIWMNDKINKMVKILEDPNTVIAICDGYITDDELNIKGNLFEEYRISTSSIKNFIKGTYWGCCMAFNAKLKDVVCPFPQHGICHDLWLGILGSRYGKIILLRECCIKHRLHSNNATKKLKLKELIENRFYFFVELFKRRLKCSRFNIMKK